jgi:dynamin GTPase
VRIGLFTPDRAFDMVSKAQIAKLREPSLKLVDLVTSEMMNMCKDASAKVHSSSSLSLSLTHTNLS